MYISFIMMSKTQLDRHQSVLSLIIRIWADSVPHKNVESEKRWVSRVYSRVYTKYLKKNYVCKIIIESILDNNSQLKLTMLKQAEHVQKRR